MPNFLWLTNLRQGRRSKNMIWKQFETAEIFYWKIAMVILLLFIVITWVSEVYFIVNITLQKQISFLCIKVKYYSTKIKNCTFVGVIGVVVEVVAVKAEVKVEAEAASVLL